MKDPQRISNLRKFVDNYDWSGVKFPMATKDIKVFETNDNISVNVLLVERVEKSTFVGKVTKEKGPQGQGSRSNPIEK